MKSVIVVAAADAESLRVRVADLVAHEDGVAVRFAPCALPEPSDLAVLLVVLSPAALADAERIAFVEQVAAAGFPVVPVVEDLATYDFSSVRVRALADRDAAGWQPGDGAEIVQAVRGHLGQEAFPARRKVFLSYRRKDGQAVAEKLYDDLWAHGYAAFLDLNSIEPGAVVQTCIVEQIADKDFVLLVNTPLARGSDWVQAEIVEALCQRIPVRVLSVGATTPFPLLADVEQLAWDPADARMLDRVRALVARGIGSSASFDTRVRRTLSAAAGTKGLRIREVDRRQIVLSDGRQRVLVEYEPAPVSLERLHRLYAGYRAAGRPPALLVAGEEPLLAVTQAALAWARGRAALDVVPLVDLYSVLDRHFPTLPNPA